MDKYDITLEKTHKEQKLEKFINIGLYFIKNKALSEEDQEIYNLLNDQVKDFIKEGKQTEKQN